MGAFISRYCVLIALVVMNLATVSAFGQADDPRSQALEDPIAEKQFYAIPKNVSSLDWLKQLVEILKQDLVKNPQFSDKSQVLLGDALHWIGHFYEERQQFALAWEAHNESYEHYLLSKYKVSPAIKNLRTVEHARFHIARAAKVLGRNFPMGMSKEPQVKNQAFPTELEFRRYLHEIELVWLRVSPQTYIRTCGGFF